MASGLLARCTTQGALVIYSIVVMALFSGMRSILELILVSYVVLAWVGLSHLFIKLRHVKARESFRADRLSFALPGRAVQ